MRITYDGPFDAVEVPDLARIVRRGADVDVPDELAARLLEQAPWTATPATVLNAAGGDSRRAARLLAAEQARSQPRAGLITDLEQLAAPTTAAEQAGDELPDGAVAVVLAWVEADPNPPARARLALQAERLRDTPRATLVEPLLAATGEDHD